MRSNHARQMFAMFAVLAASPLEVGRWAGEAAATVMAMMAIMATMRAVARMGTMTSHLCRRVHLVVVVVECTAVAMNRLTNRLLLRCRRVQAMGIRAGCRIGCHRSSSRVDSTTTRSRISISISSRLSIAGGGRAIRRLFRHGRINVSSNNMGNSHLANSSHLANNLANNNLGSTEYQAVMMPVYHPTTLLPLLPLLLLPLLPQQPQQPNRTYPNSTRT
mmetsp:Transcript_19261/g.38863  ORF Transcript_19261/g.38863 Transcript_19261/m.38863 type:complete len:219 (-) Transcript_19261:245-901(-)